jgi:hypothetical protein
MFRSPLSGLGQGMAAWLSASRLTGSLTQTSDTSIGRGQYQGTNTNDDAAAGNIGETRDATAALQSVSAANGVPIAVSAGIALTPGDWEVGAIAYFLPGPATTVNYMSASITASSTAIGIVPGAFGAITLPPATVPGNTFYTSILVPPHRVSLSANSSRYLVVQTGFGSSNMTVGGAIHARRVR